MACSSSLLLAAACGDDAPAEPNPGSGNGDDTSDDGTADQGDDSSGPLDAGRLDARVSVPSGETGSGDGGKSDGGKSDTTKADGGKSDTTKTDAGKSDGGTTDPVTGSSALKPKCVKKDTQVMVIGDSYINWVTHTFPQDIIDVSKQKWRMEAIGAYSMGSGGIGFIPDQFKDSIARDPDCHTILMDGGGNDALVADANIDPNRDCLEGKAATLPQCQKILDLAIGAADKLLIDASSKGIRDVVYFFYPHVPEGTLLGGSKPNVMLDFAKPQVQKFCEGVEGKTGGKTRCTFVDMVPVFEGHDDWFFPGDIHEISEGSQAMAKKIWQVMKDKCIAQPSGSGCCEE